MKIYTIKHYFFGSNQVLPFNYWSMLLKFLHPNILGKDNKYHDDISLYSISPLFNSKTVQDGLLFKHGAIWLIRTPSIEIFKDFYLKAKNSISKELGYGLILKNVEFSIDDMKFNNELIISTSPIFLGQNENTEIRDHITFKHGNLITSSRMKQIIITKASKLGYNLNEDDFNIEFDLTSPIKTKRILIGNVSNIASQGKIKISGNSDVIALCYSLGIGKSTGCGFGFCFNI